jgi:hypothetical protein
VSVCPDGETITTPLHRTRRNITNDQLMQADAHRDEVRRYLHWNGLSTISADNVRRI